MKPLIGSSLARLSQTLANELSAAYRIHPPMSTDALPMELLAWGKLLLPKHFAKPPSKMHRWLAAQLDEGRQTSLRVNLLGPRGGAKSTIATLGYVLQSALEAREPYIWIVSDTKDQARTHLENVKIELTENEQLAKAYPHATGRGERWRSSAIALRNGVVIESYGSGQRIRGRRRRADRPSLIVCDDLQNDSHMQSARRREASRDWFHGTLLKAGNSQTKVINLATALHRDALAMQLHTTPGWQSALFKAIEHWPTNTKLWDQWEAIYCDLQHDDSAQRAREFYLANQTAMQTGAELLWPEEEDLYTLMQMRIESGHTAFEREKQNAPIDAERCEWPESYFEDQVWFDDWPEDLVLRTMALDPSKGADARQGDYSALVMLGVDSQGVLHVEADLARRPTPQMVADGVAWFLKFRPAAFGVEANQWQQLLAGEFVAEFHRRGVLGVQPCEINNYVSKPLRIRRLGPYLSQRRLRFKRGSESTNRLVDQLRDFPLASHDDGPDALEMALRLAEEVWQGKDQSDGLGDRLNVG